MNRDEDTFHAEALRWHAASLDDAMDWDGFTAWLEADPRHAEAYDAVALAEALIDDHRASLPGDAPLAANDDAPEAFPLRARAGWKRWAGMAIAASLVAVLAVPSLLSTSPTVYQTGDASRAIALEDGSSVLLAPHSSLSIEDGQSRMALNGGAWFDIRHDPSRSLAITAGGVEIADIGTRFDVQANPGQVRVEVAEGSVSVSSAMLDRPIHLAEGRGLAFDARAGTAMVMPLAAGDIGEWRAGRLSFDAAPLALVAADLSRYSGTRITVAKGVADRQFSGTLVIGNGEAAVRDLSQLMGIELRRGPSGLVLDERR